MTSYWKKCVGIVILLLLFSNFIPAQSINTDASSSQVPVNNSGFEAGATGEDIPGWSTYPSTLNEKTSVQVTDAKAYEGEQSVLIEDQNSGSSVGLDSDPIPITSGKTYVADTHFFIGQGQVRIYLKYLDSDGKEISSTSNGASSPQGNWGEVSIDQLPLIKLPMP